MNEQFKGILANRPDICLSISQSAKSQSANTYGTLGSASISFDYRFFTVLILKQTVPRTESKRLGLIEVCFIGLHFVSILLLRSSIST